MIGQNVAQVEVAGHRARVLEVGTGDPVVVLHGWGGRIESMASVIACLESSFRVLALDLPGFGESRPPTRPWGTADYAAFMRAVIVERGVQSAHFVGHSFGAKTALYLAASEPDVVDKLVLCASSGLRKPPSLKVRAKRTASRLARVVGTIAPGARDAIYRRIASQDYLEAGPLRPTFVKVVNEDLRQLLPRIAAPTLLVWGTDDDAVPLAHARIMEAEIPDAGLVLFEGAGHFAYLDQPERFCRVVSHFFGP